MALENHWGTKNRFIYFVNEKFEEREKINIIIQIKKKKNKREEEKIRINRLTRARLPLLFNEYSTSFERPSVLRHDL